MTNNIYITEQNQEYIERYELASSRIRTIHTELWDGSVVLASDELKQYFIKVSYLLMQVMEIYEMSKNDIIRTLTSSELHHLNISLYDDIRDDHYNSSFANPDVAVKILGQEMGPYLCALYTELRGDIVYAFEERLFYLTVSFELFIEIYNIIEDNECGAEQIRSAMYYYFFDYSDITTKDNMLSSMDPSMSFARDIIMNEDLSDPHYLYYFGEYITDNEYKTSMYLNSLSDEQIADMARTFTEGFKKGYDAYKLDLSCKKTVNIRYTLGFERIVKATIEQFRDMGLEACIYRAGVSITSRSPVGKIGYYGGSPNKQYDYDHRMDMALIFDKAYGDRRLSEIRLAYESMREEAAAYAGPAVMEIFGEKPFIPEDKDTAPKYSDKQRKQHIEFKSSSAMISNEFIPRDKCSFTIIAYPVPEIGQDYKAIFDETIKVNTLNSDMYEHIQTCIINALDEGEYVHVTGRGNNHTDIKIALTPMTDKEHQTRFENCLADVNIPLGEVFTSPTLKGTEGQLHVTQVYLNGLKYTQLNLTFKDGVITDYSCDNFDDPDKNRTYVKENILFQHDTLPIGEFAIGTNTTAYVMGQKYNISDVLPILIAEKTGPHFAVGDTCFSHEEDHRTYNPDGREMIAKENDYSKLRNTDSSHAYFNCHTDITIPYDELGNIIVNCADGRTISIIENGRFILDGTEELNRALDEM